MFRERFRRRGGGVLRHDWRKLAAGILIAAIAIPGVTVVLRSGPSGGGQLTERVSGAASSGWINDEQAFGGGAMDLWPTMVSIGDSIFIAFTRYDPGTGVSRIEVMESIDGGIVWSSVGDLSPGSQNCSYPAMTVYNGFLYVAFQYELTPTNGDVYCYKSSAGGAGPWTSYAVRADSNNDQRPAIEAVTIANYAGIYLVFENDRGGSEGVDLLVYKSSGDAFTYLNTVAGASDSGQYRMADMSVYQDQNNPIVYVAYQALSGAQNDIFFVRSLNGGIIWSSPYQVTSDLTDESAPSISAGYFYVIVAYVMGTGSQDVYATIWNGATFGAPSPVSNTVDYEGWPEVYNWWDDFYIFYSRGTSYFNGNIFMQTAAGSLSPYWSAPVPVSDPEAAAQPNQRPGIALCDRPDSNFYFATAWSDFRVDGANSDIYYTTQGCRYTVRTDPAGETYMVDDVEYTTEQTFNWPAGYQHTLTAISGGTPFYCWDDGTNQWFTSTITPYATTTDVAPGMTAYYYAIPEFTNLILPVLFMIGIVTISIIRRRSA